jgi:mRNA interferase YafQ
MRTIERTSKFKRDFKRELKGNHKQSLTSDLTLILKLLIADKKLPSRYRDHSLIGDWQDHRDCHIKPDLVLIYRKPDELRLQLIRLGSHSELGL